MEKIFEKVKLIPLKILVLILPLITKCYMLKETELYKQAWYGGELYRSDFYLYGKNILFYFLIVLSVIMFIWGICLKKYNIGKKEITYLIPVFAYSFFVLASTIFAYNKEAAFSGFFESREPVFVLLGYVIMLLYAFFAVKTRKDFESINLFFVIGIFLVSLVGILQAVGVNLQELPVLKYFIISTDLREEYEFINDSVNGIPCSTLFNSNYAGTYAAIGIPACVYGIVKYKKLTARLVSGISFVTLFFFLLLSESRTGLAAIAVELIFIILVSIKKAVKKWYFSIPALTFLVLSFLLVNEYTEGRIVNRVKDAFNIKKTEYELVGIDTTGDGVRIKTVNNEYMIQMNFTANGDFQYVVTEAGNNLKVTYLDHKERAIAKLANGNKVEITTIIYNGDLGFQLTFGPLAYSFTNRNSTGNYLMITETGKFDECIMTPNPLAGYEKVASSRGYIWGKTLGVLPKYILIGAGPDNYCLAFPQNDYVARNQGLANGIAVSTFVTRPHNFYLQMAVNTGVLSLLAVLVLFIGFIVEWMIRRAKKSYSAGTKDCVTAIVLMLIGFMVCGLANDSLIATSPLMWMYLGIGHGFNHKTRIGNMDGAKESLTEE